jgi:hypothetical protein
MRGAIPLLPQYSFMAWCLVKHRDNFTFTFTLDMKKKVPLYIVASIRNIEFSLSS